MAILSQKLNQVEVRIRRHPQKTYFDEYVKVGDREKTNATSSDRYIIPEPGQMYTVEVTLKKGYHFGNWSRVSADLFLPGVKNPISSEVLRPPSDKDFAEEDITVSMAYSGSLNVNGRVLSGSRFAFRTMEIGKQSDLFLVQHPKVLVDENLQNETNVMGIVPNSLSTFMIKVARYNVEWKSMTKKEQEEDFAKRQKIQKQVCTPKALVIQQVT
jgi:hypothetical protein